MSFNVVGLFDDPQDARTAAQDLRDAGFSDRDISFVGNNARGDYDTGESEAGSGAATGATGGAVLGGLAGLLVGLGALVLPGIGPVVAAGTLAAALTSTAVGAGIGAAAGGLVGALVGAGVPEEDANVYAEGIRRGGSLLSVDVDSDQEANRAAEIMNRNNVVDIDRRGQDYRQAGWSRVDANAGPYDVSTTATEGATVSTRVTETSRAPETISTDVRATDTPIRTTDTTRTTSDIDQGEQIRVPVVEEALSVGKRAVEAGGVRVYQRVQEVPVNEQVTLREERVTVERRPVDRPVTDADLARVQEGVIEARERHEEAVVEKEARIVEEVRIRKDVEERTETIQDTVRRTDVDVEEIPGSQRTSGVTEVSSTGTSGGTSTGTTTDEGIVERGGSTLGNAAERATGTDLDRDGDVGRRDPRNNF